MVQTYWSTSCKDLDLFLYLLITIYPTSVSRKPSSSGATWWDFSICIWKPYRYGFPQHGLCAYKMWYQPAPHWLRFNPSGFTLRTMHEVPQVCAFPISRSHSPWKGFSDVYTKCRFSVRGRTPLCLASLTVSSSLLTAWRFLLSWSLDGKIQGCYQIHVVTALRSHSPLLGLKRKEDVGGFTRGDIPGRLLQPGWILCLVTNSQFI